MLRPRLQLGLRDPSTSAVLLGGLLAVLWALHTPDTADLAAQTYRADLFAAHGFLLWDNNWYGGHYLPGYSLLYPPLAAVLGLQRLGILLVPLAAFAFAEILRAVDARARRWSAAWFAVALSGEIIIGRLTFLLGLTVGLWAVLMITRRHPLPAVLLAAVATISSPVAGAFLLLIGTALMLAGRTRDGVAVVAGAAVPLAAMATVSPDGGVQPFALSSFVAAIGLSACFVWLVRRQHDAVRWSAVLYLGAIVASYVIPTPVGSNVVRLGVLLGGPVLLAAPRVAFTPVTVGVLGAMLLYQVAGPIVEFGKSASTPSRASVYLPLVHELAARHAASQRVEIVPTMTRWEVVRVAERFPLARGWETQLDRQRNALFFEPGALTASSYRAWLDRNGVGYVVLPAMPLERWGRAEGALVGHGLAYLQLVWSQGIWRLYRVAHSTPLAGAPASGARLTHSRLTFTTGTTGTVLARVRFTPRWTVTTGNACVVPAAGGLTRVVVARPGRVSLSAEWGDGSPCHG